MPRGPEAVPDQVDDAHAPVMDLEDLEPIGNPVPDLPGPAHDGSPPLALETGVFAADNRDVVVKQDRLDEQGTPHCAFSLLTWRPATWKASHFPVPRNR